jgi:benzoylformate decarboxylase
LLLASKKPVVVAGDDVARAGANNELVRLVETIGASVWTEGLKFHNVFPTSHPSARLGLPLDRGAIKQALGDSDLVLLIGGQFFEDVWHADDGPFPDGVEVIHIEASSERLAHSIAPTAGIVGDIGASIAGLANAVSQQGDAGYKAAVAQRNTALAERKDKERAVQKARAERAWDRDPISMPRLMAEISDALPENAIVVDESITASIDLARTIDFQNAGDYYGARGGGIGQGIAGALGIAVAEPQRPVVCLTGDGSAMYAIQALWTAAHMALPIVFVVLANREYRILKHNIDVYRQRFDIASQEPYAHMDLGGPRLGFVEMAQGMGVAGTHVTKPGEIGPAMRAAFDSGKAHVIEIDIEAKR